MATLPDDERFAGAIPALYEQLMVPMLFAPYAELLAERLAARAPKRVLELAAGTGAATRELAKRLDAELVATDLNPPMLAHAASLGTARPVEWRQADAMALPFDEASFDAVVCQFGAMFFPDKPRAYAEARRVLRPGGVFVFATWDGIETNDLARVVQRTLDTELGAAAPRFMERVPHGYHDVARIVADVAAGGFASPARVETIALRSPSPSARHAATAFCQGTPTRNELEALGPDAVERATRAVEAAMRRVYGTGAIDASMCAHLVTVER